jgi:hypothetical protein
MNTNSSLEIVKDAQHIHALNSAQNNFKTIETVIKYLCQAAKADTRFCIACQG